MNIYKTQFGILLISFYILTNSLLTASDVDALNCHDPQQPNCITTAQTQPDYVEILRQINIEKENAILDYIDKSLFKKYVKPKTIQEACQAYNVYYEADKTFQYGNGMNAFNDLFYAERYHVPETIISLVDIANGRYKNIPSKIRQAIKQALPHHQDLILNTLVKVYEEISMANRKEIAENEINEPIFNIDLKAYLRPSLNFLSGISNPYTALCTTNTDPDAALKDKKV